MYIKGLFLSIIVVFFAGCATSFESIDMPKSFQKSDKNNKTTTITNHTVSSDTGFYEPSTLYKKREKMTPTIKKVAKNSLNFSGSGYIKGIVLKSYYLTSKHRWIYHIKGIDFTNNKLKYAKVYSLKRVAHPHDMIYAVISDGFITSSYTYKSSQSYKFRKSKQKRKISTKIDKTPTTRGRVQVINAPEVEKVIF